MTEKKAATPKPKKDESATTVAENPAPVKMAKITVKVKDKPK